jgi:hypothetical protein
MLVLKFKPLNEIRMYIQTQSYATVIIAVNDGMAASGDSGAI